MYRRLWYRYIRIQGFYCTRSKEMIDRKTPCEKYKPRGEEYDLSDERFEKVDNDIRAMLEYFKQKIRKSDRRVNAPVALLYILV